MNELSVTEKEKVCGLLRLGWSVRRIARETGHHRATIDAYKRTVDVANASTASGNEVADPASIPDHSGRQNGVLRPEKRAEQGGDQACVLPEPVAASVQADISRSICEPHRTFIESEVAKGRNAVAIYQDLVEHHGYTNAYDAVKRFVRTLRPVESKISCRFETAPGQEAQVDYGEGAPTLDARSGKYRKPRLFVMALGYSRHAFRAVVERSSQQTWCELHEQAFAYFGGAPAMIRLDNLREGVLDPDVYDPELNRLYAALLQHYGVIALPCRPYAPDLKGKVESAVGYTQATALTGRRFASIDEQNAFLRHWNERWAATRIHGTIKRQVREMFEQERSSLLALPAARFEYYRVGERRVHLDGHVEIEGAYYSAPSRYAGTGVIVHIGRLWVRIIDPHTHQLIREHAIVGKGQRRTVDADLPKQTPPQVEKLVARTAQIGPAAASLARRIENDRGALALRTLFGMLDLARRYGPEPVERACELANAAGSSRVRFLRTYLSRHATPKPRAERHPIIADIQTYAKHLATRTEQVQGELFDDQR